MSAIALLRDLVASSRRQLINAAAVKARKREFNLPLALDNWAHEKEPTDPEEKAEQDRVILFLETEYKERFLMWSRHVLLLRMEEKRGWR